MEVKNGLTNRLDEFSAGETVSSRARATAHYNDDKFKTMIAAVPAVETNDRRQILGN